MIGIKFGRSRRQFKLKGLLVLVVVVLFWIGHSASQQGHYRPVSRGNYRSTKQCEPLDSQTNACFTGCNDSRLLVGELFNCSHPGNDCCDQFDTAHCTVYGTCECKPGYEPIVINHYNRFPVMCLIAAGQPCREDHAFTQFLPEDFEYVLYLPPFDWNHHEAVREIKRLLTRVADASIFQRNKWTHTLYNRGFMAAIMDDLGMDYDSYPTKADWGCASGKCLEASYTCAPGVNRFFGYFIRPQPPDFWVAEWPRFRGFGVFLEKKPMVDYSEKFDPLRLE